MAEFGGDLDLALRIRALVEGQDAIVRLGESFIDINRDIESLTRGLTAITGSSADAGRELDYLASIANKYGLSLLDISKSYVKLIASAQGTKLEGEGIKKVFESTSAALAALGADTVIAERAFNALSQMMSKGQIYSEELKGQLAEAIPGALNIMSKSLGITTKDMLDLMSAGSLGSEVLLPFAEQLDRQFGQVVTTSNTFSQAIGRLRNAWTEVVKGLGDTGIWTLLTKTIGALGSNVATLAGILGSVLGVALVKTAVGIREMVISTAGPNGLIATLKNSAFAAEQAATKMVASAQAQVLVKDAALATAAANLQQAQAQAAAVQTAAAQAAANQRLVATQQAHALAQREAAAATAALATAQNELAATQTLGARIWGVLAGPGGLILGAIAGFELLAGMFTKTSDAQKELNQGTEDYEASLRKMNTAQVETLIETANESIVALGERKQALQEELQLFDAEGTRLAQLVLSWHSFLNVLKFWQTDEEQRRQTVLDSIEVDNQSLALQAKRALAFERLRESYAEIVKNEETARNNLQQTSDAINEQQAAINNIRDSLNSENLTRSESINLQRQMSEAIDRLNSLEVQESENKIALTTASLERNKAEQQYAEYVSLTIEQVRASIAGDEKSIIAMDSKSQAIARNVQHQVELNKIGKAYELQLIAAKAAYEALDTVEKARQDSLEKQAKVYGDLAERRQASIEKMMLEVQAAKQLEVVNQRELDILRNSLAIKQQELDMRDQDKEKIEKEITQIKAQIISKNAEIQARKENIKGMEAEAVAAKLANSIIGASYNENRIKLISAKSELLLLKDEYQNLLNSGSYTDSQLELALGRIADKQKQVDQLSNVMKSSLQQAAEDIGVDWDELETGIDFKMRKMIDGFQLLAVEGKLSAEELSRRFDALVNAATTTQELDKLRDALIRTFLAGQISIEEAKLKLAALQVKMADVAMAASPLQQAMEKLGVGVPEKLAATAEQMWVNQKAMQTLGAGLPQLQEGFMRMAEAELESAEAGNQVNMEMLKEEAAALGLSEALRQLTQEHQRHNLEFDALIKKYEQKLPLLQKAAELEAKITENQVGQNEIDMQRAAALGKTNDAIRLVIGSQELAIQKVEQEIDAGQKELDLHKNLQSGLEKQKKSVTGLNEEQQRQLESLNASIPIEEAAIVKKQQLAEKLKDQQFSYQEVTKSMQTVMSIAIQEEERENQLLESKKGLIEAELRVAKANGDTAKQIELTNQIIDINVQEVKNSAEAKKDAADAAETYAGSLINLAMRDGEVTAIERSGIEVANQSAEAARNQADAADELAQAVELEGEALKESNKASQDAKESANNLQAAGEFVNGVMQSWTERLNALGPAARQAFDGWTGSANGASATIEQMNKAVRANLDMLAEIDYGGTDSFIRYANETARKALEVENSFYSQRMELARLTESLNKFASTGKLVAGMEDRVFSSADALTSRFNLLDEQDLSGLRSALDSANAKLKEMKENTENAKERLGELNAELLESKGQDQRAKLLRQELDYESRLAEIEKQREEAQMQNNTELVSILNKQKAVLGQINAAKIKNIEEDENAKQSASTAGEVSAAAWSKAADEAERTSRAMSSISGIDLSGVSRQIASLHGSLNGMNTALGG